ncbi:MAG: rhomboid family intramembrane serine protease [Verrucomicrobium sp.]|nr:rhomboid family intramembrane serine protease [Verrucomicrobium sp.]
MRRRAPLTFALIAGCCAVFLLQLLFFYGKESGWIDDTFALSPAGIAAGRWWQLFTYGWLHSETLVIHILFNMLMLQFLGRELEEPLGPRRFLALYLGSLLCAGLLWLATKPEPNAAIEGASGAVFGLLAAYACYAPRRALQVWVLFVLPLRMTARTLALALVGVEILCQAAGWLPSIAHTAHLGGALFGFVAMRRWRVTAPAPPAFADHTSEPLDPPHEN